jgi:hypothetical protein
MEHLWSKADATGGNRSQVRPARKRLERGDWQPLGTHGNRPSFDGKEGVDGSSPSEGFTKGQQNGLSCCREGARTSLERPSTCPQDLSPASTLPRITGSDRRFADRRAPPCEGGAQGQLLKTVGSPLILLGREGPGRNGDRDRSLRVRIGEVGTPWERIQAVNLKSAADPPPPRCSPRFLRHPVAQTQASTALAAFRR